MALGTSPRSPRWPLLGTVAVWSFYGAFWLLRSPAAPSLPAPQPVAAGPQAKAPPKVQRTGPRRLPRLRTHASSAEGAETATEKKESDGESTAIPGIEVGPDDAELLSLLSGESGRDERIRRLEEFVAAHPDHALARATLISLLLPRGDDAQGGVDAALGAHIKALQDLLPELGLPDIFMARFEMLAGRPASAESFLLRAAEKDLTWLPDADLLRLKVEQNIEAGLSPTQTLMDAMRMELAFIGSVRPIVLGFLPRRAVGSADAAEAPGPEPSAATARALLRFGSAMQENGLLMIESLVGFSVVRQACAALEARGELGEEERALLKRGESILGQARLGADLSEDFLGTGPGAGEVMERYLRDLVEHGERRASRRQLLDRLAGK